VYIYGSYRKIKTGYNFLEHSVELLIVSIVITATCADSTGAAGKMHRYRGTIGKKVSLSALVFCHSHHTFDTIFLTKIIMFFTAAKIHQNG